MSSSFCRGHETTVGLIGNGVLALMRHPEQLALLRDEPALVPSVIEELLRYDSPQQTNFWTITEEVTWDGRVFEPGPELLIMVGVVNRDPAQFADQDTLDIARADNRHLAISHGVHFCLGAPLARAEAQISIPTLMRRFPKLTLAAEPQWEKTTFIRRLSSLPLVVDD